MKENIIRSKLTNQPVNMLILNIFNYFINLKTLFIGVMYSTIKTLGCLIGALLNKYIIIIINPCS